MLVAGVPEKDDGADLFVPQSCCWPMGSSWDFYIAQSVMVSALKSAGVANSQFLCAQGPLPQLDLAAFSVATDERHGLEN